MTLTSTLKICIGVALTACTIGIINHVSNDEPTLTLVTKKIVKPKITSRTIEAPIKTERVEKPIFYAPIPTEKEEAIPYIAEVITIEGQKTQFINDELSVITGCHFRGCYGGCGITNCYIQTITEIPVEEEESILAEQVIIDPYLFEAKTYPNPTIGNATVELDIEINGNFTIQLFDLSGKLITEVFNGHLDEGRQSFQIDLYDYQTGMYFVSIQSIFQQETLKIQKI
jgi:hypothetical protein